MRRKTGLKNVICSPDSSCVIAHKDPELYVPKHLWNAEEGDDEEGDNEEGELIKFFGVGFKKTGTTSLDKMFSHLIDTWGGSRAQGQGRVRATQELIQGVSDVKSLALAKDHHYFQDSPWCQEPQRLYRKLAYLYPTGKRKKHIPVHVPCFTYSQSLLGLSYSQVYTYRDPESGPMVQVGIELGSMSSQGESSLWRQKDGALQSHLRR